MKIPDPHADNAASDRAYREAGGESFETLQQKRLREILGYDYDELVDDKVESAWTRLRSPRCRREIDGRMK